MRHRRLVFIAVLVSFLVLTFPNISHANTPWMLNYEPKAGYAGITQVYILGTDFGDEQGTSTVTIGGAYAVNDATHNEIVMWSNGMIIAKVPTAAAAGPGQIVVTTGGGSTSSTDAADPCCQWFFGGGAVVANFVVIYPGVPHADDSRVPDAPGSRYVAGTWIWDNGFLISDGGEHIVYSLNQGIEANGKWPITGSIVEHFYPDNYCHYTISSGTLDENGDVQLLMGESTEHCFAFGEAFKIIDARSDITSPIYEWGPNWGSGPGPDADYRAFLNTSDGEWLTEPMVKQLSDIPNTEVSTFSDWWDQETTKGRWLQTISLSSSSSVKFGGRLVFEEPPASDITTDNCYWYNSDTDHSSWDRATQVTGGAWWVDVSGTWGYDIVGFSVDEVKYYRDNQRTPCGYSYGQAMYIDTSTGPQLYQTNELLYTIDETTATVCSKRQEPQGATTPPPSCKPYPY